MNTLGSLIVDFFRSYLVNQKGCSPNTLTSYSDCIRLLLSYSCNRLSVSFDKLTLEMIDDALILDFLDHLEQDRDNTASTRNQRLAAIKTLFRFLALQKPVATAVCERVCAISEKRTEHRVIPTLDNDEVKAILSSVTTDTVLGARDQALLTLLYNTGARVQELVDLDVSNIRTKPPVQVLLTGKGRKQRLVPLYEESVTALLHYLKLREQAGQKHDALFLNARGQRITRFGIAHIVSRHAALAAQQCPSLSTKKLTPHIFRHTTALHLIQSGTDISVVKEWLGHADINTSHLYVNISIDMKRKALEAMPPPTTPLTTEPVKPLWHDPGLLKFLQSLSRPGPLC